MANLLIERQMGALPSNFEVNPRREGKSCHIEEWQRTSSTRAATSDRGGRDKK